MAISIIKTLASILPFKKHAYKTRPCRDVNGRVESFRILRFQLLQVGLLDLRQEAADASRRVLGSILCGVIVLMAPPRSNSPGTIRSHWPRGHTDGSRHDPLGHVGTGQYRPPLVERSDHIAMFDTAGRGVLWIIHSGSYW